MSLRRRGKDLDSPTSPSPEQLSRWGLVPSWSRRVTFTDANGSTREWHVLDTGPAPLGTIVCVHGNPSWGYLWRDVLRTLSPQWRVIAVDQTGMGYSDRPGPRRMAERVDELVRFCRQEVDGPLVLVAHDWGGPIAVGAARDLDVRALVLANTAVAKPDEVKVPPLIAVARRLTALVCERTPLFVDGAAAMTAKLHREALRAPYRSASRRRGVADFVADIPVRESDASYDALSRSARTFSELRCPILLLWGGRDPVFHDRFLRDLRRRAPHAQVERFARAAHYVCLDEPVGTVIGRWLDRTIVDAPSPVQREATRIEPDSSFRSILANLEERADDPAAVYRGPDGTLSWRELAQRSTVAASALRNQGVERGTRVSILIKPGVDLLVAAVAVWKLAGVPVVADASAGVANLRRLLRAAAPRYVLGTPVTLGVALAAGFAPGASFAAFASLPGVTDLRDSSVAPTFLPATLEPDDVAAIVHTSGATGPAKPVRYTHGALCAQRDAIDDLFDVRADESFTTSFAPFMLLAPVLGMGFVRPDFDVNRPSNLDFDTLYAAVARDVVTAAWLSPAAAESVVQSAHGRRLDLRRVMLAGAPISCDLARAVEGVTTGDVRAPYGMTECLPVTDGANPLSRGANGGTSTGRALRNAAVVIVGLDDVDGPELEHGRWGEILVSAPWMFDGYDARWSNDDATRVVRDGRRYHRTGDVGYLEDGILFQLGRAPHVIRTAHGALASVAVEEPIASALAMRVAAVAVGPPGSSLLAIVVETGGHLRLAPEDVTARVRQACDERVAAVLTGPLPTDRRHESKVDRTVLSLAVSRLLAGS